MPKLLKARPAEDTAEEATIRRLARSRHAPGDWIDRATMIVRSWEGCRVAAIARELGCHPQTVRERLTRFNADGLDGLGDRPGAGRKPRITEEERSIIIGLVRTLPHGALVRQADGTLSTDSEASECSAHWTLDALTKAAQDRCIAIKRSQVRRILPKERVRWRGTHPWSKSTDPEFAPKGLRSSRFTPSPR